MMGIHHSQFGQGDYMIRRETEKYSVRIYNRFAVIIERETGKKYRITGDALNWILSSLDDPIETLEKDIEDVLYRGFGGVQEIS